MDEFEWAKVWRKTQGAGAHLREGKHGVVEKVGGAAGGGRSARAVNMGAKKRKLANIESAVTPQVVEARQLSIQQYVHAHWQPQSALGTQGGECIIMGSHNVANWMNGRAKLVCPGIIMRENRGKRRWMLRKDWPREATAACRMMLWCGCLERPIRRRTGWQAGLTRRWQAGAG